MVFRAPAGAGLSRITYTHDLCGAGGFRAGLLTAGGTWLRYAGPRWCGLFYGPTETIGLGGTPAIRIAAQCLEGPCLVGTTTPGRYAAFRSATTFVSDSTTPALALRGGSALAPKWLRGSVDLAMAASDNVGIRYADLMIDSTKITSRTNGCDYTRVVPCASLSATFGLNTRVAGDGRHTLMVRTQDTAGTWGSAKRTVSIDNTPPTAIQRPVLDGPAGWRQSNRFAVRWTNPDQPGTAPIVAVKTAICPTTNAADDWAGCALRDLPGTNLTRIDDLEVPAPGEWDARLWLQDAAGNSSRATAVTVRLRLDDDPPTIAFAAVDADDPARIDVRASDATSGLAGTELEIRREGSSTWSSIPTKHTAGGFYGRMDDEHLADGSYALRARARDAAGNERSTDRAPRGGPMIRTVPLRINTRLVVGKEKRARRSKGGGKGRRRLNTRPKVGYGLAVPLQGRLTTPGGNGVAAAPIDVWEQPDVAGASWRRAAVVRTNAQGRFTYKAPGGPSRALRFHYRGTPLIRARSSRVDLRVTAASSMRSNRPRVVNGDEVVFRGRVKGRPLPATGKLLQLQVRSRGRWLTFATPRATDTGRWKHRYRFTATRGTVRYRFRARLPRESGFPYAAGRSRQVKVIVRGL
jgi:hypothetical protein